jgi:hypothetical protein
LITAGLAPDSLGPDPGYQAPIRHWQYARPVIFLTEKNAAQQKYSARIGPLAVRISHFPSLNSLESYVQAPDILKKEWSE